MATLPLITEIKPILAAQLTGEQQQHQRLPFFQGQFLQAIISAKGEGPQLTLEINGQKLTAESSVPLQVGQKIDIQVASLLPRMELQIVTTNPVNRWLGNVLPLLGQQSLLMPEVATLAADTRLMSQLSTSSQATLHLYAGTEEGSPFSTSSATAQLPQLAGEPSATARLTVQAPNLAGGSSSTARLTAQVLTLIVQAASTPAGPKLQAHYQEISGLLQQILDGPSLSPKRAEQAAHFIEFFAQAATGRERTALLPQPPLTPSSTPVAEGETELLALLEKMVLNTSANTNTLSQLLPLVSKALPLPASHPLQQVLTFLMQTGGEGHLPDKPHATGPQVEQLLNRLGITMERHLADNNAEKATQSLKFALLEVLQQARTTDKGSVAPEQLVKTLELYQLLHMRLANEAFLFLPLPFPFLDQGYLLTDADDSGKQSEAAPDQANQSIELHLQLEGLGNIQIDIRQQDDRIAMRFLTEDAEKAKFVAGFREELAQRISTGTLETVQFLVGAKEPIKTLLEKIMGSDASIIDTRA